MTPSASPYAVFRAEDWRAVAQPLPRKIEPCRKMAGFKSQKRKIQSVSIATKKAGAVIQKSLLTQEDPCQLNLLF